MTGNYRYLITERDGPTFTIWMNWPERRNALCLQHMQELTRAFGEAGDSDATGVVLAAKGKVFCTGHDFADMAGQDLLGARRLLAVCARMMEMIEEIPRKHSGPRLTREGCLDRGSDQGIREMTSELFHWRCAGICPGALPS